MVYNLSLQYLQNTEDAEDVTQEVFIRVYENMRRFSSSNSALRTWIFRITINASLDLLRTKRTKKRNGIISNLFCKRNNEPLFDQACYHHAGIVLEEKEAISRALSAIQELPRKQRAAIILARVEEKTQKEISEIMDISIKAVESLMHRAKSALKTKLELLEEEI